MWLTYTCFCPNKISWRTKLNLQKHSQHFFVTNSTAVSFKRNQSPAWLFVSETFLHPFSIPVLVISNTTLLQMRESTPGHDSSAYMRVKRQRSLCVLWIAIWLLRWIHNDSHFDMYIYIYSNIVHTFLSWLHNSIHHIPKVAHNSSVLGPLATEACSDFPFIAFGASHLAILLADSFSTQLLLEAFPASTWVWGIHSSQSQERTIGIEIEMKKNYGWSGASGIIIWSDEI